jgi:hypothetical protein
LIKACLRRSIHCTLSRAKFITLFKPSANLDFGLLRFRVPSGKALNRAVVGLWHLLSRAQRSANYYSSRHLASLSSSKCLLLLGLSKTSNRFSYPLVSTVHCRTAGPGGSRSCRSLTISGVPGEMTADVFAHRRSTYCSLDFLLYLQTHVVFWCHKSSQVNEFVDAFENLVTKSLSGVKNRPITNRNHVFYVFFVDLQPNICLQCRYHRHK